MKTRALKENDIVLIYVENKPSIFARVEKIFADVKPNWWRVKFLVLQFPVFVTTWILDNDQIRGAEFTINGVPMRIEIVKAPEEEPESTPDKNKAKEQKNDGQKARILSLSRRDD